MPGKKQMHQYLARFISHLKLMWLIVLLPIHMVKGKKQAVTIGKQWLERVIIRLKMVFLNQLWFFWRNILSMEQT